MEQQFANGGGRARGGYNNRGGMMGYAAMDPMMMGYGGGFMGQGYPNGDGRMMGNRGGGRGGNFGGVGRGGGSLKGMRQKAQAQAVEKKSVEETQFFWSRREKFHNQGGRAPPSEESMRRSEIELFSSHSGVVGINFNQYDAIPVEVNGPGSTDAPALKSFDELGESLPPFLSRNVQLMKYANPTPIQRHAIPLAIGKKDLMCCAQTGSGKTCAFLLPVTAALGCRTCSECGHYAVGHEDEQDQKFYCEPCWDTLLGSKMGPTAAFAVVMAPTRELALQIHLEARKLTNGSCIHPVVVYGGAPARAQLEELALGGQILVATPGRLIDFVDRGVITLSKTRFLVLDEADRMLDMGFEPQIRQVVQKRDMPLKDARQTLMFSATFPTSIQKLASEFMRPYVWIAVGRVGSSVESIKQSIVLAPPDRNRKLALAAEALNEVEGRTLIFVQKKATADWLSDSLRSQFRFNADAIHGDRNQSQREGVLAAFREGRCRVLVATDVAARGLDIPEVRHVINFDLPMSAEEFDSYVHRIGRTGRAGHIGKATGLYVPGFDPKHGNGKIARQLLQMLQESGSDVPDWFLALPELNGATASSNNNGGNRGPKFGGRDVRGSFPVPTIHSQAADQMQQMQQMQYQYQMAYQQQYMQQQMQSMQQMAMQYPNIPPGNTSMQFGMGYDQVNFSPKSPMADFVPNHNMNGIGAGNVMPLHTPAPMQQGRLPFTPNNRNVRGGGRGGRGGGFRGGGRGGSQGGQ